MRRRHKSSVVVLKPVEKPWDLETEVLLAIEARQKLQTAIAKEKRWHEAEDLELLTRVIKEIGASDAVNVDSIAHSDEAAKTAAECYAKRVEALENTLGRISRRIEQVKTDSSLVVSQVLTKKIEVLDKAVPGDEATKKELQDQSAGLKDELAKLPKPAPKKAAAAPDKQA